MPEPIDFRILQNVQAAILAISVATGFHYTVAALAVKLDPNSDVETLLGDEKLRPFVLLEVGDDTYEYQPANRIKVKTPIALHAVHDSDSTDDNAWMLTWSRLCADLEQAIAQDISRGGLAVDTRIITRTFRAFGGRQVWAIVNLEILTVRTYGAPNG